MYGAAQAAAPPSRNRLWFAPAAVLLGTAVLFAVALTTVDIHVLPTAFSASKAYQLIWQPAPGLTDVDKAAELRMQRQALTLADTAWRKVHHIGNQASRQVDTAALSISEKEGETSAVSLQQAKSELHDKLVEYQAAEHSNNGGENGKKLKDLKAEFSSLKAVVDRLQANSKYINKSIQRQNGVIVDLCSRDGHPRSGARKAAGRYAVRAGPVAAAPSQAMAAATVTRRSRCSAHHMAVSTRAPWASAAVVASATVGVPRPRC